MTPLALAAPAVEPVPLAAMKAYLRLDGDAEDELVGTLVAAARLAVERATRLCLVEQGWRLRVEAWPAGRPVPVRLAPVLAVDAVRVVDGLGIAFPLSPTGYRLDASAEPARLLVDAAAVPPAGGLRALEIDLLCGFGPGPASVPEPLRLAVMRLVAAWFERRGDEAGPGRGEIDGSVEALLAPYRRPRLL